LLCFARRSTGLADRTLHHGFDWTPGSHVVRVRAAPNERAATDDRWRVSVTTDFLASVPIEDMKFVEVTAIASIWQVDDSAIKWVEYQSPLPSRTVLPSCLGTYSSTKRHNGPDHCPSRGPPRGLSELSRHIYGIGKSTREFIKAVKAGKTWLRATQRSAGNGALTRIPAVLLPHVVRDWCRASSLSFGSAKSFR
jgi:hypothetical protein